MTKQTPMTTDAPHAAEAANSVIENLERLMSKWDGETYEDDYDRLAEFTVHNLTWLLPQIRRLAAATAAPAPPQQQAPPPPPPAAAERARLLREAVAFILTTSDLSADSCKRIAKMAIERDDAMLEVPPPQGRQQRKDRDAPHPADCPCVRCEAGIGVPTPLPEAFPQDDAAGAPGDATTAAASTSGVTDEELRRLRDVLNAWWDAAKLRPPFTPGEAHGSNGCVWDADGLVIADCGGWESRADVIAALLNATLPLIAAADGRAAALAQVEVMRKALEEAKKHLEGLFQFAADKGVFGITKARREVLAEIDDALAAAAPRGTPEGKGE
jgi:hypothetical protein